MISTHMLQNIWSVNMPENMFQVREKEIFNTLRALKDYKLVLVGGYAVNSYTLPRFSVDCDIVVKDKGELDKIEKTLLEIGYTEQKVAHDAYAGSFMRYEKKIAENFNVSIDILMNNVTDRQTGVVINADWIFENSKISVLRGKTISEKLNIRIIRIDALMVMKIIACRSTDIRDVFMMIPHAKNRTWIKSEISSRCDFTERMSQLIKKIESKQFKDGLSGVFGYLDQKVFDKHKKAVLLLQNEL